MNLFSENDKGALFSDDKKYRYVLWRIWNENLPKAMCIGLNPSKANSDKNDNTISNLINIFDKLKFGGFYMCNCYPYISSNPKDLYKKEASIDMEDYNLNILRDVSKKCSEVIFAWGDFKMVKELGTDKIIKDIFPNAKCFGKNKSGSPFHPRALVYIKGALENPTLIKY